MNYPPFPLPHLSGISHHDSVSLYENKITGEKSLHATVPYQQGNVFAAFEASEVHSIPNKYTVQVNNDTHITLLPEELQYINHSCRPNVFFNTTTFKLICIRDIAAYEEVTFFYPSTEWMMELPFTCFCGNDNCLHDIRGAFFLSNETISQYRFTDFILQKLNMSSLQKV